MKIVNRTPVLDFWIQNQIIRLQLDLGSGTTLTLFPEALENIDVRATGDVHESMGIEGVPMYNTEFLIERVSLGDLEFQDLIIREDDHTQEHRTETIEYRGTYGRAGRGLFENGKLVIDYQSETLTFIPLDAPPEHQSTCSGIRIPLETDKQSLGLTTKVQTDIGELFVVWDTGARGNVMLKKTTDRAELGLVARDQFRTERFEINGHEFGPVRMNVWDIPVLPPDLNALLGYWFFSDKIVCVDFPLNSLVIRPASGQ